MPKELQVDPQKIIFKTISVEDLSQIKKFDCDNDSISEFLIGEAFFSHLLREASTTLVFVGDQLAAFYTLQRLPLNFDVSQIEHLHDQHRMSLDLARLGVSKHFKSLGIGSYIVKHIIDLAIKTNERFITLDALYESWTWYQELGFNYTIEKEIVNPNASDGLVNMILELYDEKFINEFFDE
ncbi:GNAT family N-acetyltransferase [Paenibacillus thalictri]|nr:GNAT family N-acetyltransferase [Paenibacillus thalictri]